MKDIKEIEKTILQHIDYIREHFFVEQLGFFGSVAKNEQQKNSDIDILVSFQKGHKDFFNYMRLKYFLEAVTGLEVDLVMKDAVKPQLKERIFEEVVYV